MKAEVVRNIAFYKIMRESKEDLADVIIGSMTVNQQIEYVGPVVQLSEEGIKKILDILEQAGKVSVEGNLVLTEDDISEEMSKHGLVLNPIDDGKFEVLVMLEQDVPELEPEVPLRKLPGERREEPIKPEEDEREKEERVKELIEKLKEDEDFKQDLVVAMTKNPELKDEIMGGIAKELEGAFGDLAP